MKFVNIQYLTIKGLMSLSSSCNTYLHILLTFPISK